MEITKTRGRPRAFDRSQALEQALQLFWAHGYEGTSLKDLTSALGINAPSLYAAFESKPQLYSEAIRLYLARQYDIINQFMVQSPTAKIAIEAMLRNAAEQYTAPQHPSGCPIASGVLRCAEAHADVAQLTAEHRLKTRIMMQERMDKGRINQDIPADVDVGALARFYAGVIQGMSVQAIDGVSKTDLIDMVNIAMQAWPTCSLPTNTIFESNHKP